MRRNYSSHSLLWAAVATALAATACSESGGGVPTQPPSPVETTSVSVVDNAFNPRANKVSVGQSVTWTWQGNNPHNVTFDVGAPNSTTQASGQFSRNFQAAGVFTYFCTVHGRSVMSGSVTVE